LDNFVIFDEFSFGNKDLRERWKVFKQICSIFSTCFQIDGAQFFLFRSLGCFTLKTFVGKHLQTFFLCIKLLIYHCYRHQRCLVFFLNLTCGFCVHFRVKWEVKLLSVESGLVIRWFDFTDPLETSSVWAAWTFSYRDSKFISIHVQAKLILTQGDERLEIPRAVNY
jgi:hypothetical protein